MRTTANDIITLRNICKTYNKGDSPVHALDQVNLTVEPGEFLSIVGRSGSGKSTLMNILGCLDTPDKGEYLLKGEDVSHFSETRLAQIRNQTIGFVFQGFNLLPELTALENVELPLRYRGISKKERTDRAKEALERVGLGTRIEHRPGELSGGQQQRAAIARAIAACPAVLLADEPTGNLDSHSGDAIMEILHHLHTDGCTLILITHDNRIAQQAQRTVSIRDGHLFPAEDFILNGLPEAR